MYVLLVLCSVSLLIAQGEGMNEDEWIDPTDMLNYDSSSKTMRTPTPEPEKMNDGSPVQTKMEECAECPSQKVECPDITECHNQVTSLQREIQEQKSKIVSSTAQKPGCSPVFRRYLTKLLNGVEKLGLPSETNTAVHYDAEVRLTRAAVSEIQRLLSGDDSWKAGALDEALSQILLNFKRHDHEAWVWRFEDTFGVEMYTVVWVCACILMVVATICTELWSKVSWFSQFKRLFAFCFFISIIWNWLYLYKVAFAAHQKKMVELLSQGEKCTGLKQIDWMDSLTALGRRTFTLQDDPCNEYYENLLINPLLLVPPSKVIAVTITTFFTEPMKPIGKGISEFLIVLLKDMPITLQIPVLVTIVLCIMVIAYTCVQSLVQHAIPWPRRGYRQDPPPLGVERPQVQQLRGEAPEVLAWGDGNPQRQPPRRLAHEALENPGAHRRRGAPLENLGHEEDGASSEEEREELFELEGAHGPMPAGGAAMMKDKESKRCGSREGHSRPDSGPDLSNSETQSASSESERRRKERSPRTNVPDASSEPAMPAAKTQVENIGAPTQETSPILLSTLH